MLKRFVIFGFCAFKENVVCRLRIPEGFVWKVCYQVASALKECHSRSRNGSMVLHRDLKPANIFLDSINNVKIGDFGLARVLQPHISYTKTCVGTPYYMSPVSYTKTEGLLAFYIICHRLVT